MLLVLPIPLEKAVSQIKQLPRSVVELPGFLGDNQCENIKIGVPGQHKLFPALNLQRNPTGPCKYMSAETHTIISYYENDILPRFQIH